MHPPDETELILNLLAWHQEAGVDTVIEEQAVDWLGGQPRIPATTFQWPDVQRPAQKGAADMPSPRPSSPPARAKVPVHEERFGGSRTSAPQRNLPPAAATVPGGAMAPAIPSASDRFAAPAADEAARGARSSAAGAGDMTALAAAIAQFDGCGLKATAKSTCVYRGAERARVMIVGEAPGRDEDLEGRPFVGRAGQLLDRMLKAIELSEADVHITNVVYWRPPGNRTPTPEETAICRPFLERQVELVGPDVLLLLGGAAAKSVLEAEEGIMRLRGKWREASIGRSRMRALATLHPAYLLRTPAAKRLAWRDLLALKMFLVNQ
ncbi:MAG: uracil-DNA glycosylase family protein [Hyphomicrobiaceae bacterium]